MELDLMNIIGSVGFPIVAYFMVSNNNKELTKVLNDLSNTLKGIEVRLEQIERERINENRIN